MSETNRNHVDPATVRPAGQPTEEEAPLSGGSHREILQMDHRRLFEGNPGPMWIFNVETLAFLDANEAAVRHYGYSREEFLSMTIRDIRPPEEVSRLLADRPTTDDSPGTTLWRHRKKEGTIIDVEITSFGITFAGKPAKLVLANDVTERKRVEEQNRYRALLLATITDAVVATDENFVITGWNAAAESIYGWKAEEVMGRPNVDFIRTEFTGIDRLEASRLLIESGRLFAEVIQRRRDGEPLEIETRAVALCDESGKRIGYVSMNRDVTARKRAEGTIRALLGAVIGAQEEERTRVARELHDETAQSLSSLLVELRAIDEVRSLDLARAAAAGLRGRVAKAIEEVQRIARGLRPAALDALGLGAALERLGLEFSQVHGIAVDVHVSGLEGERLPSPVEIALYRIAQEALTNSAKHAAPKAVSVLVQRAPSRVQLIVEDDGRGFDVIATSSRQHLGLQGMRERAALLGGTLSVEATPGKGTTLYVRVPMGELAN